MHFLELNITKAIYRITLCLESCGNNIYRIIQYFETNIENHDDLDKGYEELTKSVIGEMDKNLRLPNTSKKIRFFKITISPTSMKN